MYRPAYLMLSRHSIYYYRWPLPKTKHNKQQYICISLGTREPKKALPLARTLDYYASLIDDKFKALLMNNVEIRKAITEYFQRVIDERKKSIQEEGLSEQQLAFYQNTVEQEAITELLIEDETLANDKDKMARIIEKMNLSITAGTPAYQTLRKYYYAALPAYGEEILRIDRTSGQFTFAPQIIESNITDAPVPVHNLSTMVEKYLNFMSDTWKGQTMVKRKAQLNVIVQILGSDFNISNMDASNARHVRDTVEKLPAKRNTEQSIFKAIENNTGAIIGSLTRKQYIGLFSSFFQWCVNDGYVDKNFFQSLNNTPVKTASQERTSFTDEQMQLIIAELDKMPHGLVKKDYEYWGTLISIYTGLRVGEVSQLELDDIKQDEGIWYFDINDDEDKTLKTKASKRLIPIHNKLLELGLLEYRTKLKDAGESRLLYELPWSKRGYGKNLSRFFNDRLIKRLGIKVTGECFHCLRHTVNTKLLQADVDMVMVKSIIGHKKDVGTTDTYFKAGYTVKQLKPAMDKLSYAAVE